MTPTRYSTLSDGELLEMSLQDPDAFGAFYDRFEEELLAFFMRATGRADLAADLTAEVFAAALSSAGLFRAGLGSARGWLFGSLATARRHVAARERGRSRPPAPGAGADEPHRRGARADRRAGARDSGALRLLESLPDDQRVAVKGRVLQERGYDELADSLRCSQSVVRQRVSRGLRSLRAQLEQAQ